MSKKYFVMEVDTNWSKIIEVRPLLISASFLTNFGALVF